MIFRFFRHIKLCTLGIGLMLLAPAAWAQEGAHEVVIITHPATGSDSLTQRQIFELYTLEKNKWQDGSLVYLFELKEDIATRQIFYDYLRQKPRDLKKIWMRAVLSGEGRTPKVLRTESEIVQRISEVPGALGYVSANLVTNRVKVLARISARGDGMTAGN